MSMYLNVVSNNLIKDMVGINKDYITRNEVLIEIERIRFKITYDDTSFITYAVLTNVNEFNNSGADIKREQEVKDIIVDDQLRKLSENNVEDETEANKENKEKSIENRFEVTLISKGIELFLINDLSLQLHPIINLSFNDLKVILLNTMNDEIILKCNSSLIINYFNVKISLWEPFIEKFNINLSYKMLIENQATPNQNIVLLLSDLNINMSEEFVNLITCSYHEISDNLRKTIKKNQYEKHASEIKVSNYILKNYSGEKISLTNGLSKILIVENGDEYDLTNLFPEEGSNNNVETLSRSNDDFSMVGGYYIEKILFLGSNFTIDQLNINLINTKEFKLNQPLENELQSFSSIIYSAELNNLNRTYYFYSNLMFENHTNLNLIFIIISEELNRGKIDIVEEISIKSGKKLGIPQKYINYNFYIKIEREEETKDKLSFRELMNENKKVNVDVEEHRICLKKETQNVANSGISLSLINIYSPYKLENYLPFKITTRIYYDDVYTNYLIKENSCIEITKLKEVKSSENFEIIIRVNDEEYYSSKNFNFQQLANEQLFIENSFEELEKELILENNLNPDDKINIKLIIYMKMNCSFCFAILTEYYFINCTDLKEVGINYLSNKKSIKELNFSSTVNGDFKYQILPSIYEKFNFQYKEFKSDYISLSIENVAIDKDIILKDQGLSKYQFILERDIYYLKFNLIKKIDILLLKPKFIIRNNLPYEIMIKEYNNPDGDKITIKKESQIDFHFIYSKNNNSTNNQSISFSIINKFPDDITQITDWSDFINLQKPLDTGLILSENVLLNSKSNSPRKIDYLVNILVENTESTKYLVITETNHQNNHILVKNLCENYTISLFHILKSKEKIRTFTFEPNTNNYFNWSNLSEEKYLKIDLQDNNKKHIEYYVLEYVSSLVNFIHSFDTSDVNMTVFYEGGTQIIQFKEKKTNKKIKRNMEKPNKLLNFFLLIENINISLIGNTEDKREEITNVNLKKINFLIVEEIRNVQKYFKIHFKVFDIQIDNFISANSPYKVVLFKLMNEDTKDDDFIELVIDIKQNQKINMIYIEKIDFLIQSFSICLDSDFLYNILIFLKNFDILLDSTFVYENINQIFDKISKFNNRKIQEIYISSNKQKIYINYIRTSPINFLLSFKNLNPKFFRELNIKSKIIQNILDVFTSNERVNIRLKSIEMAKVFGYSDKIITLFKDYYKFNLMTQAVKLLFSIDILGNPIGLLENIAGGVKDFFYLPIQGFVKGPIYFIQGGAKGTKSLISHTIGGAFDSTQKITSSIGKHVLKLTDAEEYMCERQKLIKPKQDNGLINRVLYSMKFFLLGLKFAIKDFFVLPIKYSKNKGILGLPKGLFFGLTSLFIKPLNGSLDFVSFVSGHLALNFLENYDFSKIHNLRNKRILWGNFKKVKSVNKEDELTNLIIKSFEFSEETTINIPINLNSCIIHDCFIYYSFGENEAKSLDNFNLIVFFNQSLGIYNFKRKNFLQIISIPNIINLKVTKKKVEIEFKLQEKNQLINDDIVFTTNYITSNREFILSYQLNFELEELKDYFISFLNFIRKNK